MKATDFRRDPSARDAGARINLPALADTGSVTSTKPRPGFCLPNVTRQLASKSAKPPTSSVSTTPPSQCCSNLVHKALSFSRTLADHIRAIWYFIQEYYARIQARFHPALLKTTPVPLCCNALDHRNSVVVNPIPVQFNAKAGASRHILITLRVNIQRRVL